MTIRNLEHVLAPRSVAVIGASTEAGSVGNVLTENLLAGGFAGEVYLVNPHHESIGGRRCYPRYRLAARDAGACGDRHQARHRAGLDRGTRQEGHARRRRRHGGIQPRAEAGDARSGEAVLPAHHRAELPRHRRAWDRAACQFRAQSAASGQARLSVAIRRADHRHPRLGRGARHRLLLCRVDGRHGGCRCGRSARFPRRRHRHPVHPALSRDHPRRAEIHVGGEIGRARQAGHRHQVRPLSGIGAGRGHAYRRAGRQRCRRQRGLPPGRPRAGRGAGGAVRGGRDADLAQARGRQRADDPDQWRRRRRARGRRSDPIGRPARTA